MRILRLICTFCVISLSFCAFGEITSNGLSIGSNETYFLSFNNILEDEFDFDVSCASDTEQVDIVFAIDTTSSMGIYIISARFAISDFISSIESYGYDYNLGGITFGDGTNIWDFDLSTPSEMDMTNDLDLFMSNLSTCDADGGDDTPETSLDAIYDAINEYNWRSGAKRILILFTDAPFCAMDFPTSGDYCFSSTDVSTSMTNDIVYTSNTLVFILYPTFLTSDEFDYYQELSTMSGGTYYDITSGFAIFFRDVTELINSFSTIDLVIENTGDSLIENIQLKLLNGECIDTISSSVREYSSLTSGESVTARWRIEIDSTCFTSERCFGIQVSIDDEIIDTLFGCTTNSDCECEHPEANLISPPPGIISSCEYQDIKWYIASLFDDLDIDETSITINCNFEEFSIIDPEVIFVNDTLSFTPLEVWNHGDSVDICLTKANDNISCPILEPICTRFIIDLNAPDVYLVEPIEGYIHDPLQTYIFDITDDIAGIDSNEIEIIIHGVSYSPYTDYFSFDYNILESQLIIDSMFFYGMEFEPFDSINICISRKDYVSELYCGPNTDVSCWTWIYEDFIHNIYIPEVRAVPCDTTLIPVIIDTIYTSRINSISCEIKVNNQLLEPFDILLPDYMDDWSSDFSFDSSSGIITFNLESTSPLFYADSILFYIKANVACNASGGDYCPLEILDFQFNDGFPSCNYRDGLFIALWRVQEWICELRINSTDYSLHEQILAIGGNSISNSLYNPGSDLIILPPEPSRIDARLELDDPEYDYIQGLRRDMRGLVPPCSWKVITFEHVLSDSAIITWNSSRLPEGIFMLNNEIDMKVHNDCRFATGDSLIITWTQPEFFSDTLYLCRGWNLLSFPIIPRTENLSYVFPFSEIIIYGYDAFEGGYYIPSSIENGNGYFVFSEMDTNLVIVGNKVLEYRKNIFTGWNLIGSTIYTREIIHTPLSPEFLFIFNCSEDIYENSELIQGFNGYWYFSDENFYLRMDF